MTREQLGDLVGLDKEAIGRIERGERMNFDNLEPIATALLVGVRELFVFDDLPVPAVTDAKISAEALRIAYLVDRRSSSDPTYARRVLEILKNI